MQNKENTGNKPRPLTEHDTFRAVSEFRKKQEKAIEENHKIQDKQRLAKLFEKKIKTAFIGAIAKFETYFGNMWKGGLPPFDPQKDSRKHFKELWELCRTEVLNNGNNQLRAMQAELQQYSVEWDGYKYNLEVIKNADSE